MKIWAIISELWHFTKTKTWPTTDLTKPFNTAIQLRQKPNYSPVFVLSTDKKVQFQLFTCTHKQIDMQCVCLCF